MLEIGPRLEGHLPRFSAIQTHPSCRFHLAVNFPGLHRSGAWSQIINQAQDFPEQFSRHRHLGQLERDVPAMADHLSTNLHQFLPQRGQRPVLDLLWQSQRPHEVGEIVGQGVKLQPDGVITNRFNDFGSAILRKLILEIAGKTPKMPPGAAAASADAATSSMPRPAAAHIGPPCDYGERRRRLIRRRRHVRAAGAALTRQW